MAKSKVIILVKHFDGLPKFEDFSIIEENLRDLEIGEFLVEALFFSVDPYIRRPSCFPSERRRANDWQPSSKVIY